MNMNTLSERRSEMYSEYTNYVMEIDNNKDITTEEAMVFLWVMAMKLQKKYGVQFSKKLLPEIDPISKILAWYSANENSEREM